MGAHPGQSRPAEVAKAIAHRFRRTDGGEEGPSGTEGANGSGPGRSPPFSSRSDQLVVYVPAEAGDTAEYHTSRLCPDYPSSATSINRHTAEDEGHTFCWTCFELEMRALNET
ncbi:MAG: hypothetical protein ABEI31_06780 [Halodesulfurarchaeum sp.]